jgi:kynurenine formamidase
MIPMNPSPDARDLVEERALHGPAAFQHRQAFGKEILFVCLPLKMRGGAASPVRPAALVI